MRRAGGMSARHYGNEGGYMYSASIRNKGDSKYYAATKGYRFVIDTEGGGANPIETVLSGLCGCLGHWARDYMRGEQIAEKGFGIRADAELTGDRRRFSKIEVAIEVKNLGLDSAHKEALQQHVRNCPVYTTLVAACPIALTVID
jgi:uncharacterized OsmC-like protein